MELYATSQCASISAFAAMRNHGSRAEPFAIDKARQYGALEKTIGRYARKRNPKY